MSSSIQRIERFTESEALAYMDTLMLGNAAGVTRDQKQILGYGAVGATYSTYGSTVFVKRPGNEGSNFFYDEGSGIGINALGIPDPGYRAHLPALKMLVRECTENGQGLIVSISAGDQFDPDEYERMASQLFEQEAAHIVEGNMACPNIVVDGKRKPVVSYNKDDFRLGVRALRRGAGDRPIGVKISPISEASMLEGLVEICLEEDVDYIVGANTIPNGYLRNEDGSPAITMGRGGLSGKILRPIVTGMIQIIRPLIANSRTKLIATGGVASGRDAYEYLAEGAHGVGVATELYRHGGDPKVLGSMINDLLEIIVEEGMPVYG